LDVVGLSSIDEDAFVATDDRVAAKVVREALGEVAAVTGRIVGTLLAPGRAKTGTIRSVERRITAAATSPAIVATGMSTRLRRRRDLSCITPPLLPSPQRCVQRL
jgi:hypothetical protein